MIDFKQFYSNKRGAMFWNTFMLFLNFLQLPKEKYGQMMYKKGFDKANKNNSK